MFTKSHCSVGKTVSLHRSRRISQTGSCPQASVALPYQAATEQVVGAKAHPGQTGTQDATPATHATGAICSQPRKRPGQHAQVMVGTDCADVAFLNNMRMTREAVVVRQ